MNLKRWPAWLIGGIIGILVWAFFFLLARLFYHLSSSLSENVFLFLSAFDYLSGLNAGFVILSKSLNTLTNIIISLSFMIVYFIVGTIVYLLIRKKERKWRNWSHTKRWTLLGLLLGLALESIVLLKTFSFCYLEISRGTGENVGIACGMSIYYIIPFFSIILLIVFPVLGLVIGLIKDNVRIVKRPKTLQNL